MECDVSPRYFSQIAIVERINATETSRQLRTAGPSETRDSQDFAFAYEEADVVKETQTCEVAHTEPLVSRATYPLYLGLIDRLANHHLHNC